MWLREDAPLEGGRGSLNRQVSGHSGSLDGVGGHGEGWETQAGLWDLSAFQSLFLLFLPLSPRFGFCSQPCKNALMRETEPQSGAEVTQELCPGCLLPWQAKGGCVCVGGWCQAVGSLQKPRILLSSLGPLTWSGCPSLPARPPAFPHRHPPRPWWGPTGRPGPQETACYGT